MDLSIISPRVLNVNKAELASPEACLQEIWQHSLYTPIADLFARPRKEIRGSLAELGFQLAADPGRVPTDTESEAISSCARLVEDLHAGSLIIDDIQDNSLVRRGAPTLHLTYGIANAINAGNWLYFLALDRIGQLTELSAEQRFKLLEAAQSTLLKAHFGQALDLGAKLEKLSPQEIITVCSASLELKSGALMALSLKLGALLAEASGKRLRAIEDFGLRLGMVLQMFDDLGNLKPAKPTPKHLEDLINFRPSFVWWYLAQQEPHELGAFSQAAKSLPDVKALGQFVERTAFVPRAEKFAWEIFEASLRDLQQGYSSPELFKDVFENIKTLGERIANAYR